MRRLLLAGAAAVVLGGIGADVALTRADAQQPPAVAMLAQADAAPPPDAPHPPPPPPPPGRPGPMGGPPPWGPPGGPMGGPHEGWMRHGPMWRHAQLFGLFFHKDDKQLAPANVQKIAEAFLLWQGNRDWKVTQVAAGPDGKIGFAFATADGGVIARFTMDSKTGRLERVG